MIAGRLALVVLLVGTAAPRLAFAGEPTADAAEWKRRGDDAMDAGRAAEALAAYRRAIAIEPSAALEYNVGRALLAVGDFVGALEAFEHFEATAPDELKRRTRRLADVMNELNGKIATLTIEGEADANGARVTIGGADVGTLPMKTLRVNPGPTEVRVERDGFEPFLARIDPQSGDAARLRVVLRRERVTAHLAIVASPAGARVVVDGKPSGSTPLDLELTPGPHRVVVAAPQYHDRDLSLTLVRDESRRIDVQLSAKSTPLTSRWWFWAGAGLLATGAATAIVAASVERPPVQGSLGTFRAP